MLRFVQRAAAVVEDEHVVAAVVKTPQRDIERLKAESVHDPIQVAQRLDVMLGQVDALQLLSEARTAGDQLSSAKAEGIAKAGVKPVTKEIAALDAKSASSPSGDRTQVWGHTEEFARWGQQVGLNVLRAIHEIGRAHV